MDKETYEALRDLLGLVDEYIDELRNQKDNRAEEYGKDYKRVANWTDEVAKEYTK